MPPFEAVRDIVEREWFAEQRTATIEANIGSCAPATTCASTT